MIDSLNVNRIPDEIGFLPSICAFERYQVRAKEEQLNEIKTERESARVGKDA